MKYKFCLLFFSLFFIIFSQIFSQTILTGKYYDNFRLTREGSPYLVVDSVVFDCWPLEIEQGVVVTFKYHPDPERKSYMRIIGPYMVVNEWVGGPPPPVIFTSERDNQPSDLNGDGTASRPMPGDWGYVSFDPLYPEEGMYSMEYVIFRYGGGKKLGNESDPGKYPMVFVSDYNSENNYYSRADFWNCTIEKSAGTGIIAGMAHLRDCKISNNNYGVRVCTSDTYLVGNEISGNWIYPVYLVDPVIKRDGNDDGNTLIESYYSNEVINNGFNVIALEGTLRCAYDENNSNPVPLSMLNNISIPYLISGDLEIDALELMVGPGTLIKFLPEAYTGKPLNIRMKNGGSLGTRGTESEKVVFTSLHDHQYDLIPPGNTEIKPVPGDWGIIAGTISSMQHTIFKYGGKYMDPVQKQVIPDSCAVLHFIHPAMGGVSIYQCIFSKLFLHGMFISEELTLDPFQCSESSFFLGQSSYGIMTPKTMDQPILPILATGNYWNGRLGPFHPSLNINGNGCMVGDHVDFSGFKSSSPDSLDMVYSVIRGIVQDQEGIPLRNVLVRLKSKNTKTFYTAIDGQFYFSNVKPGMGYVMEFNAKAYHDTLIAPLDIPADTSLNVFINLKEKTIDYAIDTLMFNINPDVSVVSVGGTAHRYYRIVDIKTREPVYGAEVIVPNVDTFFSNSKGIVDIAIPSSLIGNSFASKSFSIQRVGIETLDYPVNERETFTVSVLPYQYNKTWSGNTYFKVGIFGLEAKKERGAELDLFVKNEGSGEYADSIRFSRQSRTGFGLNFGAAAKVEAGPVSAGAEAGVGVNLDAIFEDDFKFDYPNSTGRLAVAKFIVLADGALPYMDAPLIRYFVACLERQVSEINAAALSNGIGMNLHGQASAEAGMDINLLEGDKGTIGAELKGSASSTGDITFMSRLYAHKNPVTNQYPLDLDFNYTGEVELGVNASIGFDLGKLFSDGENKKSDKEGGDMEVDKVESNLPFPIPDEDFGFDLAAANASGGIKFGLHFGTTRFIPDPYCRVGFMYGYKYNLSASAAGLFDKGISENREIRYTFDFYDSQTIELVKQTADLAKNMLSPDNLMDLNISDLTSGKVFNGPLNEISYQQTRNSFSIAPVQYTKTIVDQVDEGGFNIGIDIGVAVVKAKFGAGFNYAEVNNYPKEYGLFYNWKLYPLQSYDYLPENESFSAGPILQEIVSKSASYLVDEVKKKLIPPIFRKIKIWPFRRKAGEYMIPIGPDSRTSYVFFADSTAAITIEGIDSLDVIYWDWYGTGDDSLSSKKACSPNRLALCEYVRMRATQAQKMDYGIGGFYQFEPYNTSVGDNEVYVMINYFDDELTVMLSDSSLYTIDEKDLRMYREDKENNRWIFIGGVVDTVNNMVKARIDAFGTFTLAPFIPEGELKLSASPDTIILELGDTSMIQSDVQFYNTGEMIQDGELFTLKASRGEFAGTDADAGRDGFQVAASAGMISAVYKANELSGTVTITAQSLMGQASGTIELFIADSEAPAAPVLAGLSMDEEDVIIWWKGVSEPDVAGYLVHYDTISGSPYQGMASVFGDPSPINAGMDTLRNIAGLTPGKTYYFSVTALDRCGNISNYSNEMSITTIVNRKPIFFHKVIHIQPDLEKGTIIDTLYAMDPDKDQNLTFYLSTNNKEDAFAIDPQSGVLSVNNAARLDYFQTRIDTFIVIVGVVDDAVIPAKDEGPVMVVLDIDSWVPRYTDDEPSVLEMYPNPAQRIVTLKLGDLGMTQEINLQIFGLDGKSWYSEKYPNIYKPELEVPIQFLDRGVYHVVVRTEGKKRTGKLVVVR